MFKRPGYQRVAEVLGALNSDLLAEAECFFGGGTAIALSLGEYRESLDIDFLCSSHEGYRILRNAVSNRDLGSLLREPVKHLREVRMDRDGIRAVLEVSGVPVKIEFIKEGNTELQGHVDAVFGVPTLSRVDMYTQKLLANADRGLDKSTMSRDIIDLAMMLDQWGDVPEEAWKKAMDAYGASVCKGFQDAVQLVSDREYLARCLNRMGMELGIADRIPVLLADCSAPAYDPADGK